MEFDLRQRQRLLGMLSRRELFSRLGLGAGALALASLLAEEAPAAPAASGPRKYDLLPKRSRVLPSSWRINLSFRD